MATLAQSSTNKYWTYALWLALFTIFYNLLEGLISIFFGISDEALTLFGFGVDSFIEVMSGIGILAMVLRIRGNPDTPHSLRSQFEKTALRITGTSFYLLIAGLAVTAIYNLFTAHKPATTLPGLIISVISIAVMWLLVMGKRKVGNALNSSPILADANCTMVCIYMSVVLLASSLIYELTGFGFVDSIGALGLIYFSYNEGKESFEKAAGIEDCCEDENCESKS
ncbi:MAG: cation transporter [Anaerolineae bacterium]|nr:cation transporter [Anaerolineae bacterium]MCI0609714.1 cation transporter [Anaerolineae bacterium]